MLNPESKRSLPFFVGRYRCEEYLGGGMSDVYRARDTELARDVAIKILKEENVHDDEARASFLDEVQLACKCSHDNIVTTYDKGEYDGSPFIVMEFLRGESLRSLMRRRALGGPDQILRIALQMARAMECVHQQSIIHRDLKPENLQLDSKGRVKLVDFGIAKAADWRKTQAGFTKGTAFYMAPEQVLGRTVSFATDIWAFGAVLFEMLAGQRPFQTKSLAELWAAILNGTPDFALLESSRVSPEVQAMIRRCLEKDATLRYPDFAVICQELEALLTPASAPVPRAPAPAPETPTLVAQAPAPVSQSLAPPAPATEPPVISEAPARKRPTWQWALGGLLALLAIAAVVWGFRPGKKPELPESLSLPKSGDMVLVRAGPALLGSDKHPVNLAAFYIDKTEVSNRAYATFLQETGYPKPPHFPGDRPDDPAVRVSLNDAQAFARWAGKRLPTQDEWEKAARGSDGRLFPWGNNADPHNANVADNPDLPRKRTVMPVTSFATITSPSRALNLCGNVWEWVDAPYKPQPDVLKNLREVADLPSKPVMSDIFYAIRGGSYEQPISQISIAAFAVFPAKYGYGNIGFRCAKTP